MPIATRELRYHQGTGRRKTAIAQVRLVPGDGAIVINGKPMEEAVTIHGLRQQILAPFNVTNTLGRFSTTIKVSGGGVAAQAGAIRHGLTRALVAADETMKPALRSAGFMTRDPRVKERKKYGLKRARKAPQYTKR